MQNYTLAHDAHRQKHTGLDWRTLKGGERKFFKNQNFTGFFVCLRTLNIIILQQWLPWQRMVHVHITARFGQLLLRWSTTALAVVNMVRGGMLGLILTAVQNATSSIFAYQRWHSYYNYVLEHTHTHTHSGHIYTLKWQSSTALQTKEMAAWIKTEPIWASTIVHAYKTLYLKNLS